MAITPKQRRIMVRAARAKFAQMPLAQLAKALGLDKQTLYARLAYRGVRTSGKTLAQLVESGLTDQERTKHAKGIARLLGEAPPIKVNPRDPGESQPSAGAFVPDVRTALVGLTRVARSIGPLQLDELTEAHLDIANTILALRGTRGGKKGP